MILTIQLRDVVIQNKVKDLPTSAIVILNEVKDLPALPLMLSS
jgi:hypothetical protein